MVTSFENGKIINSIICFYSIFMMNNFTFFKRSVEFFFHNKSMFKNSSVFENQNFISVFVKIKSFSYWWGRFSSFTKSLVMSPTKFFCSGNIFAFLNITNMSVWKKIDKMLIMNFA